jgi:hypothetical protein
VYRSKKIPTRGHFRGVGKISRQCQRVRENSVRLTAKPCTPVQFRAWPPAPSIDRQAAFGGPTADAAHSLPRISGAPDFERATAKARASAALGRRQREYPVAEPGRIANRENDMFRLNLCHAAKYCCYAASARDSFGIPAYIRRSDSWKSPLAPETIFNDHACPFCPD